jgi:DNA modification methylase
MPNTTPTKNYVLIHADCVEIMRKMPDKCFDCIITDPPYGVGVDFESYADTVENLQRLISEALPEMRRVAKRVVLTPGIRNLHRYPGPTWILCWHYAGRCRGVYGFNHWQPVFAYGPDPDRRLGIYRTDVIRATSQALADRTEHPCPKPLSFIRKLISRMAPSRTDTILDPFMGSGTTGVAAVQLGHAFTGIEINGDYLALARRRIEAATPDFPHLINGELHGRTD